MLAAETREGDTLQRILDGSDIGHEAQNVGWDPERLEDLLIESVRCGADPYARASVFKRAASAFARQGP